MYALKAFACISTWLLDSGLVWNGKSYRSPMSWIYLLVSPMPVPSRAGWMISLLDSDFWFPLLKAFHPISDTWATGGPLRPAHQAQMSKLLPSSTIQSWSFFSPATAGTALFALGIGLCYPPVSTTDSSTVGCRTSPYSQRFTCPAPSRAR
ncbi:hypothetical protein EMPG_10192 [Blastomyces silverae]|uniref:Uncharacterized protein n=1 Tax=Blastomyces silverae TaxID=2060906 RepID=A0A0H1B4Q9_9EURO|nr:hypothetical protein EMPG_10192 [Blastomyces silverae]